MVSKYIQYFLNKNNLELGEEFMLADENGRVIYKDKTFFLKNTSTSTMAARNRRRIFLRRG